MGLASNSALTALQYATAMALVATTLACWVVLARGCSAVASPAARERPSHKVRVAAARLRVHSDRQARRRTTPRWIVDLAQEGDSGMR